MPYELNHWPDMGILEIRHYGSVTAAEAYTLREHAQPFIQRQGVRRLLVDLREAKVVASTLEVFLFHASHEQRLPRGIRFAMVCSPENWESVDRQFAENVTVNRGMAMESFADPESAIAWLVTREREPRTEEPLTTSSAPPPGSRPPSIAGEP